MPIAHMEENVLVISEIQGKVILPYRVGELERILEGGGMGYGTLQEIIDEKYTVPLARYRHGWSSRFREAFALMRERENSSLLDAVDLALEMMGNRYLHPAVITACRDLDQLDIYLDCLDTNELEDYPFFQVKYEPVPRKLR